MKNYRIAAICLLSAVSLAACSPAGTNVSFPNMIQVENGEKPEYYRGQWTGNG